MFRYIRSFAQGLLWLTLWLLVAAPPARAATTIVGNGMPSSCDESALRKALLNPPGGTVMFDCGGSITIQITQPITISADTTVNGDQLVTLLSSGVRVFQVAPNVSLSLIGMRIRQASAGAGNGGAIINDGTLTLYQVELEENQAGAGGAIYNRRKLFVNSVTFVGNTAQNGGAVFNETGSSATVVNSTFSSNYASNGGALYNNGGSVALTNVTFNLNTASGAGASLFSVSGSITTTNTIIAGGAGGQCVGPLISQGHNLSSDNSCSLNASGDMTNTNPMLAALQNNGGYTRTHMPLPLSAAINKGDNGPCPNVDQIGNNRPFGPACDIGAVEAQFVPPPQGPWYVSTAGSDANVCNTKLQPCRTINGAIGKAFDGDVVYVAVGTYSSASGSEVVDVNKNLTISGGWDGGFTAQVGMSTLDGQKQRRGLTVEAGKSAWMDSFVIQNGAGAGGYGGGARVDGALYASNLVFRDNAAAFGAGLYVGTSAVLDLRRSGIYYNGPFNFGGGLNMSGGSVTLVNVTVSNNKGVCVSPDRCMGRGPGIYIKGGKLSIYFSTIAENKGSEEAGSGVYIDSASANVFFFNTLMANDCNRPGITFNWNVERSNTCGFNGFADQVNVYDPGLEPLGNNGGQSWTHALKYYSPAFNAGAFPPATDQRGVARPQYVVSDVGAYEYDGYLWQLTPISTQPVRFMLGGKMGMSLQIEMPLASAGTLQDPRGEYIRRSSPSHDITIGRFVAGFSVGLYGNLCCAPPGVPATRTITAPTQLAAPMTLTVTYTDEAISAVGGQESKLRIAHYDPIAQKWNELPTTLDTAHKMATTRTTLLGEFALVSIERRIFLPLVQR
jgi:hypothetical protein